MRRILASAAPALSTPSYDDDDLTTKSTCPAGQKYSDCAIQCHKTCGYYGYLLKENGDHCLGQQECEPGCVSVGKPKLCPKGMLWVGSDSCVPSHDCLCVSRSGKPVKVKPFKELIYHLCGFTSPQLSFLRLV